jgi:hypothetical protein
MGSGLGKTGGEEADAEPEEKEEVFAGLTRLTAEAPERESAEEEKNKVAGIIDTKEAGAVTGIAFTAQKEETEIEMMKEVAEDSLGVIEVAMAKEPSEEGGLAGGGAT